MLIPLQAKLIGGALALAGAFYFGYEFRNGQVAKEVVKTITKTEVKKEIVRERAASAEVKYITKYIHIRDKQDAIIKKIPEYVPYNSGDLPHGFGVLHDAAASGEDSSTIGSPDGTPIKAQVAIETITGNYGICNSEMNKLEALQDYVKTIQEQYGK